jgi:hypothetical protein
MTNRTERITAVRLRTLMSYEETTGVFTAIADRGKIKTGSILGQIDSHGYQTIGIDWRHYAAHRLAWLYVHGDWPEVVDHVNGIRNDNRIANLRSGNQSSNLENQRRPHRNNCQGLLGVGRVQTKSVKFRARIRKDGREIHLGSFSTAEEAHATYIDYKRRLHAGCAI